ncbi:hypothetical protein Salat_1437100 [Sesamum alatum]|uniref:Uncharacterized protein n=1 Tax=Sesamum alatum TaxID=300844 RepID=A0AAE1YAK2_9LAMI|nr:hypothetical protein Salat_1437100 [Sesamum alatum]
MGGSIYRKNWSKRGQLIQGTGEEWPSEINGPDYKPECSNFHLPTSKEHPGLGELKDEDHPCGPLVWSKGKAPQVGRAGLGWGHEEVNKPFKLIKYKDSRNSGIGDTWHHPGGLGKGIRKIKRRYI